MLNGTFFYQYEPRNKNMIFDKSDEIILEISKRTRRIRHVLINNKIIATLRPSDGFLIFNIEGAEFIKRKIIDIPKKVYISDEGINSLKKTSSIFPKQIINIDEDIRPGDEVFILDKNENIIATGKSILSSEEIKFFKRGVAIKVRHKKKLQ